MRNCITIHGAWMYPPEAAGKLISLIRSGLIDLNQFEATSFDLDHANEAVTHAAANSGPFKMTVIGRDAMELIQLDDMAVGNGDPAVHAAG